jgi:hypothetical protein
MFPESPAFLHEAARRPPARHRFDPGSLLAAALFAGLATVGLMGQRVSLGHQLRWIWPVVFLGTGVALLISAVSRARESARGNSWDNGQPIDRAYVPGTSERGAVDPTWSAGEEGTGDEIGTERGEDGEIQETGRGHDG